MIRIVLPVTILSLFMSFKTNAFTCTQVISRDVELTTQLEVNLGETPNNSKATIQTIDKDGQIIGEQIYSPLVNIWDGHASGLMTGAGISIKYDSHFGNIKNVNVTFIAPSLRSRNLQSLLFPRCNTR